MCSPAGCKIEGGKKLAGRPGQCTRPCDAIVSGYQGTSPSLKHLIHVNLVEILRHVCLDKSTSVYVGSTLFFLSTELTVFKATV